MTHHHLFTGVEQRKLRQAARMLIGACSRVELRTGEDKDKAQWGCNRSYLQGVLRQLEKQWDCPHERTEQ